MILFDILLFIIFFVVLTNQNSRINKLEEALKRGVVPPVTPKAPLSVNELMQPQVPPVQTVPQRPRVDHVPSEAVSSGRILAILGIIAVFIGVGFFLKYAFDNNWISPAGRILLGILTGLTFLGVGQALRKKYLEYSDFLMGGGLAVLYLSVSCAHFFFHLIPPFTAWVFMAFITVIGLVLSIVNSTKVLAMVSVIGGFLVPFMARSGGNDMLTLFGYLSILNIGVLTLSFNKNWKELSLAAFIGTMFNFMVWHASFYTANALGEALSFCFLTFLMFLGSSLGRVAYQKIVADPVDYFVLGANAFFIVFYGYLMLNQVASDWLGMASLLISLVYLCAALWVNNAHREDVSLNIFMPGLSVMFLSIAIGLQFDGAWIAVGWLVEAFFLYVIACFVGNRGFQVMGATVYILGLFSIMVHTNFFSSPRNFTPLFNSDFAVLVLATVVAYAIAYMYKKYGSVSEEVQKRGISMFVVVANILTVYAVTTQIVFYFDALHTPSAQNYSNTLVSIFWVIYAALLTAIGFIKKISGVRRLGLALFVITACKVVIDIWSLGQIYRIVSLITFGIIALIASFAYAKYKDRLKDVI